MKYYYIYKIIFLCGDFKNHYYIGKHTTSNLNDNYGGSGKLVKRYFKKYGKIEGETYSKTIIEFNSSNEENCIREKEIIGTLYKDDNLCINLKPGGDGGAWNEGIHGYWHPTEEQRKHHSEVMKGHIPWNKGLKGWGGFTKGKHCSDETKEKIRLKSIGRKHTQESKDKIRQSCIETYKDPTIRAKCDWCSGKHWKLNENGKRVYY